MGWLWREQKILAPVEVADTVQSRARGLLGRDGTQGVLLLDPARAVHTFGMRFPIDVAYLDGGGTVVAVVAMAPNRLGRPRLRARKVIEAQAGSFARWRLAVGDRLDVGP